MPKDNLSELIESTASKVVAELACRGIRADQRVTVAIELAEPDDWISQIPVKRQGVGSPDGIRSGPLSDLGTGLSR